MFNWSPCRLKIGQIEHALYAAGILGAGVLQALRNFFRGITILTKMKAFGVDLGKLQNKKKVFFFLSGQPLIPSPLLVDCHK